MPDNIKINKEIGVIEIQSYGKVTFEDIAGSIDKAKQIFEDEGINKILVDTTKIESTPSTIEIFKLFSSFPQELMWLY